MFWKVMTEYEDICRRVVELCIGKKVSEIRYKSGQEAIKVTPESRGIRLDVYLEDDDTMYDIEMQTETRTFLGKRIRYYENVMDLNSLQTGAGGIAQDIADAVAKVRDHPQWRKDYMLFELKMRDAKQEGLEEGRAEGLAEGRIEGQAEGLAKGLEQGREDGLKQGRAEERRASVDKIALFIMKEHPEMNREEALEMASGILK